VGSELVVTTLSVGCGTDHVIKLVINDETESNAVIHTVVVDIKHGRAHADPGLFIKSSPLPRVIDPRHDVGNTSA